MKKLAAKDTPSNLKTSRQNIDEIGRTSQGAPPKPLKPFEKKFLDKARRKKSKKREVTLKHAMDRLAGRV